MPTYFEPYFEPHTIVTFPADTGTSAINITGSALAGEPWGRTLIQDATSSSVTISDNWITWTVADTAFYDTTSVVSDFASVSYGYRARPVVLGVREPDANGVVRTERLYLEGFDMREVDAVRAPAPAIADEVEVETFLADARVRAHRWEAQITESRRRARALLLQMLTAQQRQQLERDHYFEIVAVASRRRYRIRQGTHGNVRLLNDRGEEVARYCGQPEGLPVEDCMLAQKLQIEFDEPTFLRLANRVA